MAIQDRVSDFFSGIFGRAQKLTDRVVNPDTRQQFYSNVGSFANEQPLLAAFLTIQILLSFTPIALFASFVIGTILLSLLAATLFSLFWLGVALVILIPTLFVTVSLGVLVWIWAASTFVLARWVYHAMHLDAKRNTEVGMPNGKNGVANNM